MCEDCTGFLRRFLHQRRRVGRYALAAAGKTQPLLGRRFHRDTSRVSPMAAASLSRISGI